MALRQVEELQLPNQSRICHSMLHWSKTVRVQRESIHSGDIEMDSVRQSYDGAQKVVSCAKIGLGLSPVDQDYTQSRP